MPLPLIIGAGAVITGIVGIGTGVRGGTKMKEANDLKKAAQRKQEKAVRRFNTHSDATNALMDEIGKQELEIIKSFGNFSDLIEKIQGRPEFETNTMTDVKLPDYKAEQLKEVSTGAAVLLGGLGGAAAGTAGGFAAAGATTSAVMALGTASTGTAISSLSGAALTNATLAALGGGAVAAGGGGMALGTAVLGGATLGVGLLVGGIIFNATGSKLSEQAEEAYRQAKKTEEEVDKIVAYLDELKEAAGGFQKSLSKVEEQYRWRLNQLSHLVNMDGKTHWELFTNKEKKMTENLVLLVGLLYKMCQVKLVLQNSDKNGVNTVNTQEIKNAEKDAENVLLNIDQAA